MARWKNINGVLQKIAGSVRIDQVLNKLSRNAISNKAVSEKFETVDTTLDSHQDAIDGINTHLSDKAEKEWTLKGIAAGSNTVAFPESWNEILVTCYNPASAGRRGAGFIFHLTPTMVDKHDVFSSGFYGGANSNGACHIATNNGVIGMSGVIINGADFKSNYSIMVEYR